MKTIIFQGLRIRIENPAGSTRSGISPEGKPWSVVMPYAYGYIVGTDHIDGDEIDVFIGPDKYAKWVYIISQVKQNGTFDENKCFLGFSDAIDAKNAFYKAYENGAHFYGDLSVVSLEDFKKKVKQSKGNPTLIRASKTETAIQLYAMQDNPSGGNPFKKGNPVTVDGLRGRGVVIGSQGRRVTVRFLSNEYVSRDYIYVHKMTEGNYKSRYNSIRSSIENEGIPEESGRGSNKWIEKVGTQYCIRTDGVDSNLGCWPSREKAEAVMRGESFITPDVPKNLLAGGPGSGRKKEALKEFTRMYQLAKQAGHNDDSAKKIATDAYIERFKSMHASQAKCPNCGSKKFSLMPTDFETAKCSKCKKTWNYGIHAGGPGSGRKAIGKGLNKWKPRDEELKRAAKDPKQLKLPVKGQVGPPMIKFDNPSPFRQADNPKKKASVGVEKFKTKMKYPTMARPSLEANDWGEPNAGAYQHAHMDTNLWFHPPSLKHAKPVPTDDPQEKDDSFLDVTKRNSKDTKEQRMKMLKRSAPGGTPPIVPVRTTLISPTLNSYVPMYASAGRQRRRHGGGNFRAYGAARI